jgi:hypothetical protein
MCSIHTVDDFACCAREPSEWKLTNGSWLHRLRTSGTVPAITAELVAHQSPAANGNGIRF